MAGGPLDRRLGGGWMRRARRTDFHGSAPPVQRRGRPHRRLLRRLRGVRGPRRSGRARPSASTSSCCRRSAPTSSRTRWSSWPADRARARRRWPALIQPAFRSVQRTRDIVLVDQRGTGKSNPLNCRSSGESLRELTESDDAALERLKRVPGHACPATRASTPRTIAMDDLDDVRAYLGYDKINLYGGSYGTRAALVYLRRHPSARALGGARRRRADRHEPAGVRRARRPAVARQAARRLRRDAACRAAYPGLGERVRALFARLDARAAAGAAGASAHRHRRGRRRCARRVVAGIDLRRAVLAAHGVDAAVAASSAPSRTTSRACWRWRSSAKAPPTT